jgi:hypothetical protein
VTPRGNPGHRTSPAVTAHRSSPLARNHGQTAETVSGETAMSSRRPVTRNRNSEADTISAGGSRLSRSRRAVTGARLLTIHRRKDLTTTVSRSQCRRYEGRDRRGDSLVLGPAAVVTAIFRLLVPSRWVHGPGVPVSGPATLTVYAVFCIRSGTPFTIGIRPSGRPGRGRGTGDESRQGGR